MPGVPRVLGEHSLNVRPDAKPVKQPLRCFAEEKRKATGEEIARLLAAGFIMEVFYPDVCVSTTPASTRLAPRILSHYHTSTR
jgi:hypothetical protein